MRYPIEFRNRSLYIYQCCVSCWILLGSALWEITGPDLRDKTVSDLWVKTGSEKKWILHSKKNTRIRILRNFYLIQLIEIFSSDLQNSIIDILRLYYNFIFNNWFRNMYGYTFHSNKQYLTFQHLRIRIRNLKSGSGPQLWVEKSGSGSRYFKNHNPDPAISKITIWIQIFQKSQSGSRYFKIKIWIRRPKKSQSGSATLLPLCIS
mgnify:CR=1 FL=1